MWCLERVDILYMIIGFCLMGGVFLNENRYKCIIMLLLFFKSGYMQFCLNMGNGIYGMFLIIFKDGLKDFVIIFGFVY